MSDLYRIGWVGHNNYDKHDKVWGWLQMEDGRVYCFWGRRGKKLQFKQHDSLSSVYTVEDQKRRKKGYGTVRQEDYNGLVKDFLNEVELWCMTAILGDNVR